MTTRVTNVHIVPLAGVAGPAIFTVTAIVSAALRPDYSHLTNVISELGATGTPYAGFMNYAGFVPAGVLIAVFGGALAIALRQDRLAAAGSMLVVLFGTGVAAAGIFSCDSGCPHVGGSLENVIHARLGPIIFSSLIIGAAILGFRFRRFPEWRSLSIFSLVASAVAFAFMVALVSSLDTRVLSGLWQRLLVATVFLWCAVTGLQGFRHRMGVGQWAVRPLAENGHAA